MSKVNVLLLNGISLAIENVLRLSPHLLRISLSDLGLSSESLTLPFIMSSKARARGNILSCQRKFPSCPSSTEVFHDPSVLEECAVCVSSGQAWSKPSVPQTAAEAPLLHFKAVQVIISHQQKLGMYLSGLTFIFPGCDHGTETLHWTVLSSVLSALIWLCHQEWAASHRIPDWKRPMASPPHSWAWPWIIAPGKTQIKPAIHVMGEHRAGKLLFKL